jgi:hypothetical protein
MRLFIFVPLLALTMAAQAADTNTNAPIAWEDLGAKATAQYKGDGLAIVATPEGAVRLRCAFQKLEGEATSEGLWLSSTAPGAASRFRVVAAAVGREGGMVAALPQCGEVSGGEATARFVRPGVVEEYFVSVDGVRQDFVVPSRPEGTGALRLELAVSGARAQSAAPGVELVLADSGRKLAYNRLRVVDATGRELAATLSAAGEDRLVVGVADTGAQYPVRIDPTFSDANWVSGITGANTNILALAVDGSGNLYAGGYFTVIGGVPANYIAKWNGSTWSPLGGGAQSYVRALAVAGTNLFMGGDFTSVYRPDTISVAGTSRIAQWNGSAWSALGGGAGANVYALAVSGTNLYVGGGFVSVYSTGTTPVTGTTNIAQWNGSEWSALGSGANSGVFALAVAGTNLFVGGGFSSVYSTGTTPVTGTKYIAQWNGSAWSALGGGAQGAVQALAVSGTNLYVGGGFTSVTNTRNTSVSASSIAQWNGSAWSALGGGAQGNVFALAVAGTNLFMGGGFTSVTNTGNTSVSASRIAQWNGSAWSALGSGVNLGVRALALSGTNLFVGGGFTTAGTNVSSYLAQFNTGTVTVNPAAAAVVLDTNSLSQTYDGTAKSVIVTTSPTNLAVNVTYNGSANAPTNVGSYTVVALIADPNYTGGATNTLVIKSAIATNPTNIVTSVSGTTLTLSWPADHMGWWLQSQTNNLSVGLWTNWVDMPGSDATNSLSYTIDPSQPAVFYRLRLPSN